MAVNEDSGVAAPTAPVKVMAPDPPLTVSACAPLTVEPNVMLLLVVAILLVPVKLTGLGNNKGLTPDTVMLLPI